MELFLACRWLRYRSMYLSSISQASCTYTAHVTRLSVVHRFGSAGYAFALPPSGSFLASLPPQLRTIPDLRITNTMYSSFLILHVLRLGAG